MRWLKIKKCWLGHSIIDIRKIKTTEENFRKEKITLRKAASATARIVTLTHKAVLCFQIPVH